MSGESNTEHARGTPDAPGGQLVPRIRLAPAAETGGYGSAPLDLPERLSFGHYLRVLYKRRRMAVTVLLLVATTGIVRTSMLIPIYEGRVRLLLDGERLNIVKQFQDVVDPESSSLSYFQTQFIILQSRSLARRTLISLNLLPPAQQRRSQSQPTAPDPRRPDPPSALAGAFATAMDFISHPFGADDQPHASLAPQTSNELAAEERQIDAFLSGLSVAPIPSSRLVDLRYRSTDPQLAARYANTIAHEYIDQNLEFRFLATKEATDWLAARLAEQRQKVEASEQALLAYRQRTGVVTENRNDSVALQKLSDLTKMVTDAKAARIEKEAVYSQVQSLQKDHASLDAFPAVLQNSYIQQLKIELGNAQRQYAQMSQTLGERHPDMINARSAMQATQARLQSEVAKVVDSVHASYVAAQATETSLVQAFEAQKQEALAQNERGVELGVLQREAESNRQIYEILMQRSKETGITGELRTNNIRVLDAAEVPRVPVWPNRTAEIRNSILIALTAAIGLVAMFELFDNRIKLPDEILSYLGLSLLGVVPTVSLKNGASSPRPLINGEIPGEFAEAFRLVRTNVLFSAFEQGSRSIVVTSPGIGEGKTSVATNLAIAIAQAGQRVLLVDADMRRPQVHDAFGRELDPGLSNLIVGNVSASEVVKLSAVSGLWILPAGMIPPNPAEILASKRFKSLIKQLEEHFDWVIVDSPPVLAVADASVIAHAVSRVLLVVRAEMTGRGDARAAIERLEAVGAQFAGAVLNNVDTARHRYYYAPFYRHDYGSYYTKPATK